MGVRVSSLPQQRSRIPEAKRCLGSRQAPDEGMASALADESGKTMMICGVSQVAVPAQAGLQTVGKLIFDEVVRIY